MGNNRTSERQTEAFSHIAISVNNRRESRENLKGLSATLLARSGTAKPGSRRNINAIQGCTTPNLFSNRGATVEKLDLKLESPVK
jgi:hypothetical protein